MEPLLEKPYQFDFFWAVRRLQAENPTLAGVGASERARGEYLRLGQFPDFRFATSTLRSFELSQNSTPPKLSINFLGLFGPNGALPLAVTDYATERLKEGDRTITQFLDVFHHRFLSLFFRAWAAHQKTVDLDRPADPRFPFYIGSTIGLSTRGLRDRDSVPDMAKFYFSGRLSCPTKNAEGLAAILTDFFGVPAAIRSFVGQWIKIPPPDVCKLGDSPDTGLLGSTVIAGSKVWQCHTKFRVRFGPMHLADLLRLLPRHESWRRLKDWVRNYIGEELAWDVQHILFAAEVPQTVLGGGSLLGWTTWLTTKTPEKDADDVVIDPEMTADDVIIDSEMN